MGGSPRGRRRLGGSLKMATSLGEGWGRCLEGLARDGDFVWGFVGGRPRQGQSSEMATSRECSSTVTCI
ncbi:hypothetical protein TIFTF001_046804 [Ficus carica]|uniref:Uncharacterized protein n=1 Tax=Ficus carica TaxID=3494 RepID=A0AA87ZYW6_FICCA|nr:hypothetical protein TIFTF001_046797 [Ficus carica]GMN34339.1 hypothetical protein TIFTF001_046800 [Ficus carica]GMN34351.1 hypothetical protein TIFTF001_046801 [Ficus carica]GMN34368.1 hypothetical protein TIFTF001_046804 [Ficus carica]